MHTCNPSYNPSFAKVNLSICKICQLLFLYLSPFVFAFVNSCICIYHLFVFLQKYLMPVFAQGSTGDYWPPLFAGLVHCLSFSHHYFWPIFQSYYKSSLIHYFWPFFREITNNHYFWPILQIYYQ